MIGNLRLKLFSGAIIVLFGVLAAAPLAHSQEQGKNEFGIWGGYSVNNPHTIGTIGDRPFGVFALRYGRTLWSSHAFSLQYTLDVLPVEILVQPKISNYVISGSPPRASYVESDRHAVYGAGISPVGFKVNFLRKYRLQPFWATSEGFVASTEPIPLDISGATRFNFTVDIQAGLQYFNSSRSRAWILGYKFQHISNAYRSRVNPGVDFNLLYLGYSFFK
ncbi:MAG: acyloxyacyl hydrolase [Candidatus Acidiferrales bacterium]